MKITDYVTEAALALNAPDRLMMLYNDFNYDPEGQAWSFADSCAEWTESLTDMRVWGHKICGWLQFRYPDGPIWISTHP
jgi:hypothetical protein